MDNQLLLEFIGYAASLLIAISLMMRSLIRLRILNGIGAVVFVIYGLLIKAYPVAFLNGIIVGIDITYLIQMLKRSDYFSVMEVTPNSPYLNFFLEFHTEDIRKFFPTFNYDPQPKDLIFFMLRDTIPAGLMILRPIKNKGKILLDYALENFRDFKIGAFIFDDKPAILLNRGIDCLEAKAETKIHRQYLRQMGFHLTEDEYYHKNLNKHFIRDKKI